MASLVAAAQALARATDGQVAVSRLAARIIRTEFTAEDLPGAGPTAPEGGRIITSACLPSAVYGRFVGRHDELKRLGDILAAATRRRAQLVTIQGDKGIGKTRMVAEMERRLAKGNYNVGFYVAACPKNGAEVRWSGLGAMLRVLCGVQEGDDEGRILEVLPRLRALGLHSEESSAVLAQLGAAVSSTPAHAPREDPSAGLRAAFSRMVQSLCDDRLHVFVFDDAHAMDAATLEAILAVAGRGQIRGESIVPSSVAPTSTGGLRAVFALATRDDPPELLAKHPQHHLLVVGELSDDDSARLVSTRVGARVLAPDLLSFCRDRAGGHPLFLEELVKELIGLRRRQRHQRRGARPPGGGHHRPAHAAHPHRRRVSRLEPSERAILQAAAIVGEPILTDVLAVLMKQSVAQITRIISSLFARDLLRITGPRAGELRLADPRRDRPRRHPPRGPARAPRGGGAGLHHCHGRGRHGPRRAHRPPPLRGRRPRSRRRPPGPGRPPQDAGEPARARHPPPLPRARLCDVDQRTPAELSLWLSALADAVSRVRAAPDLSAVAARVLRRIDAAGTLEDRVVARVDVAPRARLDQQLRRGLPQARGGLRPRRRRPPLPRRRALVEIEMAGAPASSPAPPAPSSDWRAWARSPARAPSWPSPTSAPPPATSARRSAPSTRPSAWTAPTT